MPDVCFWRQTGAKGARGEGDRPGEERGHAYDSPRWMRGVVGGGGQASGWADG